MKPKSPFTQPFGRLPEHLPLYTVENALLPGGQLPLELSMPEEIALFFDALKTDQLIGMVQPRKDGTNYQTGCAGRIRQYRERSDGRLNLMLNGVCRYRIVDESRHENGYRIARADWSGFEDDYEKADIPLEKTRQFESSLKHYFETHNMQIDWHALGKLHIEEAANNLVLVLNLDIDSKQRLLESPTVLERIELFCTILEKQPEPIVAVAGNDSVN